MPFDDNEIEITLSERFERHARDFADLQDEMAGLDTGRVKRFLAGGADRADPSGKSKQERTEALTRLQLMLLSDPAYAALFNETRDVLNDAQTRLGALLDEITAEIAQSEREYSEKLGIAASLPDGTKVFKDRNGDVRTQDGALVAAELIETIIWGGDEPSFEDIQSDADRLARLRDTENDIRTGQAEIGDMQAAMNDEDNPLSEDDLNEFRERANDI